MSTNPKSELEAKTNPSLKIKVRVSYGGGVKCESATSVIEEVKSLEEFNKG